MSADFTAVGLVRKQTVNAYNDQQVAGPAVNERGDLLTAWSLPPKTELAKLGQTWDVRIASGSAFTFVAAYPTTRAELVLFNGEAAGGKCYVLDSAWCLSITSMAA